MSRFPVPTLRGSIGLVVALGKFVVGLSGPKLVYRNSESYPKTEVRMK